MDSSTPKPMKKVHRNIFRRVGKKLEQNLGVSSPSLSDGFGSSSDMSSSYHDHSEENKQEQDDTISLQYIPRTHTDSPKAVIRHKHGILFFDYLKLIEVYIKLI